ncbi:uncharacterized protein LOC128264305 [Drosophila gunungcola]|uniref:uncharacterized protein LOC128264305 n=1 Tax=Drosophila gunungcola TaxID=103775 RepID=UPI0022E8E24D|nr:uncharacterized protein LOC128264305 [Drosophila gunungcola]
MIEETKQSPSAQSLQAFNQHLEDAEKVLDRIEAYRLKLNNNIHCIKKLVATNQRLIARLQVNELRMKSLLDDKSQDKQGCHNQRPSGKRYHLRRTCKVTNIREVCWTQCKSHSFPPKEEKSQDFVIQHRETNTLLSLLSKDLDRHKGGQERKKKIKPFPDPNKCEEIVFKVKCILKLLEKLDLPIASIPSVKTFCRRVLGAMSEHQMSCSEQKEVRSHLTFIPVNPYLSISE